MQPNNGVGFNFLTFSTYFAPNFFRLVKPFQLLPMSFELFVSKLFLGQIVRYSPFPKLRFVRFVTSFALFLYISMLILISSRSIFGNVITFPNIEISLLFL